LVGELDRRLADADAELAGRYPGARPGRQPVHTAYVPADRYRADTTNEWGSQALAAIEAHGEIFRALVADDDLVTRVRAKLGAEPIEDLRIDFEDGYGNRPDEAEDHDVTHAAADLATSLHDGTAAPFHGIRIKSFEASTRARGVRTLARFVAALVAHDAPLGGFVATLPKVTSVAQVEAMAHVCTALEHDLALPAHTLRFEIQIETPQSILAADGTALVARLIHTADGRCTGLHYGTYDYSAFLGIAAGWQSLDHPAADHAKFVMQAAAAGTGVRLSDGSTNVLPIGEPTAVRTGWATHLRLVRRALERGYYQGWDLHPAQLPTRYAATIAFYRQGFADAALRLQDYLGHRTGRILDEPATARAMADYLVRGVHCGAATEEEVEAATATTLPRLAGVAGSRAQA
jgi:citrate lyase beta subunit